ncbi:MAG: histidine kinase, partial [Cyclobacteriaceae bacterium]|nr:histidine kinase [Cyclobacteriaceae bacterium]
REINHRFFVFETKLESGEQKDFFLFTDKYNQSISAPILVRSKDNFIENSNRESTIFGYYFGAILSILIAAIIISIISPRKINFLFIFYLLGFSLFTYNQMGFGYKYLWGEFPLFNSLSLTFFAMISILTILVFAYYFFEMKEGKEWVKKLHWTITIIITINWGFQLVYYILVYLHSPLQHWINYNLLQLVVFIFPFYFLFLVTYQIVQKNHIKYYFFLLSTIGMLSAVAIMMLAQIAIVSGIQLLEYIILIAMIVDFVTLAGILSLDLFAIKLNNQKLITSLDQAIADGAKNFLKGQQIERTRLAQEIHDGTGIRLSSIQMKLSSIETEDNKQRDHVINDLSIVSRDLRKFSHNLSSVVLEQYGLINAIEELILTLEDIYPDFTYEFDYDPITKIDQLKEKELYFIISELINNSIKHSKGDRINISFKTKESNLMIEYMDNGIGYVTRKNTKGLGLKSIEWRINILSGKMDYIQENGFNKCRFQISI